MSEFIGTCVDNPFSNVNKLSNIIDNATQIGRNKFLNMVDILDEKLRHMMFKLPYDYTYWKYNNIYFFTWSGIEHFFLINGGGVNGI